MKTRFAPTPSGYLHRGNVHSFILTWLIARKAGGRILLRIDDGDASRKRPEYVEDIFRTLEAFGLAWDEGPTGPDDFERNWSQRHRKDLYEEAMAAITEAEQVYACTCTRKQIRAASDDGRYPGTCREAGLDLWTKKPARAWRLRVPEGSVTTVVDLEGNSRSDDPGLAKGDFVIRRKNDWPAYQLSSVLDDLHFGVDTIVRGKDLWTSTLMQLYLAQTLRGQYPPFREFGGRRFLHHSLITDTSGNKLSKSAGAEATGGWAQSEANRRAVIQAFAQGWGIGDGGIANARELLGAWEG